MLPRGILRYDPDTQCIDKGAASALTKCSRIEYKLNEIGKMASSQKRRCNDDQKPSHPRSIWVCVVVLVVPLSGARSSYTYKYIYTQTRVPVMAF